VYSSSNRIPTVDDVLPTIESYYPNRIKPGERRSAGYAGKTSDGKGHAADWTKRTAERKKLAAATQNEEEDDDDDYDDDEGKTRRNSRKVTFSDLSLDLLSDDELDDDEHVDCMKAVVEVRDAFARLAAIRQRAQGTGSAATLSLRPNSTTATKNTTTRPTVKPKTPSSTKRSIKRKAPPASPSSSSDTSDSSDSSDSEAYSSMDEANCKESLRPVKNDLKKLKMDTSAFTREEKLAHLKETLSAIGSRIDVVAGFEKSSGAKEKKRKHLCKL